MYADTILKATEASFVVVLAEECDRDAAKQQQPSKALEIPSGKKEKSKKTGVEKHLRCISDFSSLKTKQAATAIAFCRRKKATCIRRASRPSGRSNQNTTMSVRDQPLPLLLASQMQESVMTAFHPVDSAVGNAVPLLQRCSAAGEARVTESPGGDRFHWIYLLGPPLSFWQTFFAYAFQEYRQTFVRSHRCRLW
ncbi:tRNA a64-2'-o-ribosylphosphate transferase [Pseudozyma hubeiensis SY62]|uniref:tRNA a64-2'-o-ribosylphosphate transferase n=1 Tax=Pseudozyma hubeiensis (strain SY62) TaxID=1305764 RepID=R9NZC2_PSEHS|nr:tRNA a64-2'-o-ribosylphosphate transferase [Pseudozyma hubeiensis SY62]GAC94114.1 tRNA a64-2'-o-ribosylphosphate transferase [Pseudozyma hubeiensis SY62]